MSASRARRGHPAPLRYAARLVVVGYVIDVLLTALLTHHVHLHAFPFSLVNTTAFLCFVLPLLYFWMYAPMTAYMKERENAVRQLADAKADLERRVEERTHELAAAHQGVRDSLETLEQAHHETQLLGELVELLQASRTAEEAEEMLRPFGEKLFPDLSGAIYLYRSSRNVLERAAFWGPDLGGPITFIPEDCWALRRGRWHGADSGAYPRCRHLRTFGNGSSGLCVPMMAQGETTGVLVLRRRSECGEEQPGFSLGPISQRDRRLALVAVEQIALAIANLQLREKLRDQAIRDPLTAMFNRRYFEETADRELRRAEQSGTGVGFIMLDIDHFKRLNDAHGHEAGDVSLRRIGLLLQSKTRVEDVACRYGGEEFVVLLPGVAMRALEERANAIREAIREMDLRFRGEVLGPLTVSCGVALYPDHGRTCGELLEAADRALYRAKVDGRDRVAAAF